jgi:hypothetical protein
MKNLIIYLTGLFLIACSSNISDYKKNVFEDKNIPFGFHFNETIYQIKKEFGTENLREQNTNFLFYDFPLKNNDSYTYAFKFYDDTLYGIEVGLFLQNPEQASALFNDIIKDLNRKFSQHKKIDERSFIWYFRDTTSQKNAEIEWRNESARFGVLTLLYTNVDF